jgi:hypothetical protein
MAGRGEGHAPLDPAAPTGKGSAYHSHCICILHLVLPTLPRLRTNMELQNTFLPRFKNLSNVLFLYVCQRTVPIFSKTNTNA